jgi:ABC-type Fe3+-hydroxamate transport system substrate-binding protein
MIKKIIFPLLAISLLTACNNGGHEDHSKHGTEEGKSGPKTLADSLYDEVMAGHDEVMPKMGKVRGAQAQAKAMLDSIAKLPAKAQDAALDLKKKLETLVNDLNYADFSMDKWMTEFNMDSAINNVQERVKYLEGEKGKVTKVKEAVLGGLARADSLFKAKLKP